jgi:hypothetical protein
MRLVRAVRGDDEGVVGGQGGVGHVTAQIDVVVVGLPQHLQGVGRLPQQTGADTVGIHHARMAAIGAGDGVEAVAGLVVEGQPHCDRVRQRQVDGALQLDVVVVAGLGEGIAIDAGEVGVAGGDEDRAARGVGAGEGALRPAQQLKAADVVIGFSLEIGGEGGDAVAVGDHPHAHGRGGFGLADAAHVEEIALAEILDRRGRSRELQLVQRGDSLVLQILTAQHCRGHGGGLKVAGAAFGGDHHVADGGRLILLGTARIVGVGLLGLGGCGAAPQQHGGRCRYPELAAHGQFSLDVSSGALTAPSMRNLSPFSRFVNLH